MFTVLPKFIAMGFTQMEKGDSIERHGDAVGNIIICK